MAGKPWWAKPLRIVHVSPLTEDLMRVEPRQLADFKKGLHVNAEHFECSPLEDGEKGFFLFKSKHAKKVLRDIIGEYIPEAHERGIKVFIYFNVHWCSEEFAAEHPEWVQTTADGAMLKVGYGVGTAFCVNSPFRDWVVDVVKELAEGYDIDGVFLDGPAFYYNACYCKFCSEKFQEVYGGKPPKFEEWGSRDWRLFIKFRQESLAEFLRDVGGALKQLKPQAAIYMNAGGLWPDWLDARNHTLLMDYQDLLGAEGGFLYGKLLETPIWKPGANAKLLEARSKGKPTVIFIAFDHKSWDYYSLTSAETKIMIAETVANGASPWLGGFLNPEEKPGLGATREMFSFLERSEKYYEDSRSMAKVALAWSFDTANYYGAEVPPMDFAAKEQVVGKARMAQSFTQSFYGYYDVLVRSHIPFDVVDEEALETGSFSRYECIVLPNCACISDLAVEKLRGYVNEGGSIVATHETSLYDEYGSLRPNFSLSDLLGVNFAGKIIGPIQPIENPLDYILIKGSHEILKGIKQKLLPSPILAPYVKAKEGSQTLAIYLEKLASRYIGIPKESENPAIILNSYGRGHAIFFNGAFDAFYWQYKIPEYRLLLSNAVATSHKPIINLEGAPQTLEVTLREQRSEGRVLIHLINFTGEMARPFESVIPCKDVKIKLSIKEAKKVHTLWSQQNLPFKFEEGLLEFSIPQVNEYEVVVVE